MSFDVSRDPSSSPLSVASRSPEPPFDYPSPLSEIPTEITSSSKSRDTSLGLDGASDSRDRDERVGPPPAKRRKLTTPKPRTTEILDLNSLGEPREDYDQDNEELQVRRLTKALRNKKKIVVIAGAGISVSAGIPDFRSGDGLFKQLKSQDKMKASGKALFDAAVYRTNSSTESFHDMVRGMSEKIKNAKPTRFHHMLASMAKEGRLLRLYTQNVDGIETGMSPLQTEVPLPSKAPWPVTIQLHGGLDKMVCTLCNKIYDFEGARFEGPEAPTCDECKEMDALRTEFEGKRSRGVGRLRPRIVLYNEGNPDDEAIGACSEADLKTRPDAVIVVGTSLKIPGLKRIVKEMCAVTRGRKDGLAAWINKGPEPIAAEFKDSFDLLVQGDCEDVAHLVGLPEWDNTDYEHQSLITDDEVEKLKGLAALKVIFNGSTTSLKSSGILTPQSPRYQSPAKVVKEKQSKLAFDTKIPPKAKATKREPKANKVTKAAPKRNVGRPAKSTAPSALKSAFTTTKSTSTAVKKDPKKLEVQIPNAMFPGLNKRKDVESIAKGTHTEPMRPMSPAAIRNNTDVSAYNKSLEIKDSEEESSFSSIDLSSEDELAGERMMTKELKTVQSPLQEYMRVTVSPKGGVPKGMENLLH